jgi:hypothetical protein
MEVDSRKYELFTGNKPQGVANWSFLMEDGTRKEFKLFKGDYKSAKQKALGYAKTNKFFIVSLSI